MEIVAVTWQPIETAPAVGKKRLLFYTNKGLVIAGFRLAGQRACVATGYGRIPATHWMPLPEPPK